jgi:hypothetical protein
VDIYDHDGTQILSSSETVNAKCIIIYRDADRNTARAALEILIGAPISDELLDRGYIGITQQWDLRVAPLSA